jgi:signal transduction histidine kinase
VLTNLLSNAIKYSPADEPVAISVRSDVGGAIFEVSDRGAGIAAADVARLGTPYTRLDPGGGTSGLGLGLYMSLLIVSAHGGSFDVDSAPGRGAHFRVRLPAPPGAA